MYNNLSLLSDANWRNYHDSIGSSLSSASTLGLWYYCNPSRSHCLSSDALVLVSRCVRPVCPWISTTLVRAWTRSAGYDCMMSVSDFVLGHPNDDLIYIRVEPEIVQRLG